MITNTKETAAAVSIYDLARVCKEVDREFEAEFGSVFAQKRTYAKAAAYADAIASPGVRVKASWDIAEHAGYENPGPVQSLIGENKWDPEELWDRIAVTAGKMPGMNDPDDPLGPGIVADETAQEKRGSMTAGVSRQYAGCAGGIINCTTWVMMSLIGPESETWISSRLFLPEKTWFTGGGATGTARRAQAGIPDETVFASKPELARQQYEHARKTGIKFNWAGGDEVYGRYRKLREDHEKNNEAYAYFVPRNHVAEIAPGKRERVDELLELADGRYETRSAGPGVNGPRYYEWAMIEIAPENHFLLLRRPVITDHGGQAGTTQEDTGGRPAEVIGKDAKAPGRDPGKEHERDRVKDEGITFCLCYVPEDSPVKPAMPNLVFMAGRRWGVEETIATGKGVIGWDENQFRKYGSLLNHTALAGLAMLKANIVRERINTVSAGAGTSGPDGDRVQGTAPEIIFPGDREPAGDFSAADLMIPIGDSSVPHSADQKIPEEIGFIRLSINELLRLVSIVRGGLSEAQMAFHIRWSKWRRRHQAIARWYHRIARISDGTGRHR